MWYLAKLTKAEVSGRFYYGINIWSSKTLTCEDGSEFPMLQPSDIDLPSGAKKTSFFDTDEINQYETVEELLEAKPSLPSVVELNIETGDMRLVKA